MFQIRIPHMNLNQIANSGQCFRWQLIERNTYKIPAFGKELIISQDNNQFTLSCGEEEWNNIWKNYFDVNTDTAYDEAEQIILHSNDDFLKEAYQFGSGIRILRQDLWEVIVSFIISQNNNIPRIKKSIEKLCNEMRNKKFPNCQDILDMDLSGAGLGYRDKYLKDAAMWYLTESDKLANSDNPKKTLMEIKGVGEKVAACICLFGLHCFDSFPVDTHIKNIINEVYGGEMPEWIDNKYAGLFQQYLFYYELHREKRE